MMNVLGIDPSLRGLGYAYRDEDGSDVIGRINPKDRRGEARLLFVLREFQRILDDCNPSLIAYEGYAMGIMKGGRTFDIGELGGVLKLEMHIREIPFILVPPSNLKLFATGSGGVKRGEDPKEKVMKAMAKTRGRLFKNSDEADAYALLLLGEAWANPRKRPRNRAHHANVALRGCQVVS